MKKLLVLSFVLAFSQVPFVFADRGGGGGGFSRGGDTGGNGGGNLSNSDNWDRGGNGGGNYGNDNGNHWDRPRGDGNDQGRPVRNESGSSYNPVNGGRFRGFSQTYNRNGIGNRDHSNGWTSRSSVTPRSGYFSSPVPRSLKRMGVTRVPRPIANRSQMLSGRQLRSRPKLPRQGPGGVALHASLISRTAMNSANVRTSMSAVSHDRSFMSQVNTLNSTETRVGSYYWHSYNGTNYCHYYDNYGCNWYGWYFGGSCFWTQYYWGNWWWWDPSYDRWCYWNDGWWWWNDPYHVNVVYIYNNGQYTPAGADNANVDESASSSAGVYRSQDGTRMVKITGDSRDAFLYDTAEPPAFKPVYLASGVKEVRFSNTNNGRALQVMLILSDGSFDLFDESGNPNPGSSY